MATVTWPGTPGSRRTCHRKRRRSDAQSNHLSRHSRLRCAGARRHRLGRTDGDIQSASAVPIKGFPHTGNILGAGTALQAEYSIAGTEYDGGPPPLIGINFFLAKGSKLHTSGFPTCKKATLEQFGPIKCSKGSAAGPIG